MVGPQSTPIKARSPLLKWFHQLRFWLSVPKVQFPGVADLISRYKVRAAAEGVDPLGYYKLLGGYAQLQVLQQALEESRR
jgi:branched-chain amino acid transport system substrate-binding protein